MASNTLSGDWRWASTRKSGMTILGKVPKPINLPSQRLENNGLDPNVEIVPKGTLTWGSRASSATPNAWSSSTLLSPKTDGSTGSPSNYSGRPSSGGSGTRPSTAGSDRSQDPSQNARGSNSRPSTASGLLPSNQSPTVAARPRSAETRPMVAARPRSAETRPGSSQLSRFAENSSEPAVAWGTPRTAEKLGVASSKTDEFSLSSGDFPTLGSDKKSESHSQQGHSSQGHSAAASATLRPSENLELPLSGDRFVEHENASTLRTERNSYAEGGSPLNVKLQNNPQQAQPHQSTKMTSHQFDSCRGPPVHPPDRVWYRGGAICGPYRPAGPPGSFPVDPFACYPRPFPPNSQAVPRSGAGLGNHHSTNGDTYCPQAPPNSYMFPSHPVIPARPGPYQAPVPYDGYYSYHQASLGSSGEQPITSMRVAGRPSLYNQRPNHNGNFTSGDFQNSPGGDDSQMIEEQIPSDRAHVPHQGHYKVLLKPRGDLEDNHPQEKGQYGSSTSTHFDSEHKPGGTNSKQEGEQSIGSRENETAKLMKLMNDHKGPSKLASDCEGQPSNPVPTNSEENSCRTSEGILKRESDIAIPVVHDQKHNSVMRKNTALIEKIEGLNNKIRCADSLSDVGQLPYRQERSKQPKVFNAKPERSAKVIFLNASPTENASTFSITAMPVSFEESSSNDPKSSTMVIPASSEASPLNVINNSKLSIDSTVVTGPLESQGFGLMKPDILMPGEAAYSHVPKRIHATQSRGDYHAKSRMDTQVDIGWTRESSVRDSSVVLVEKTVTDVPVVGILDNHSSKETILASSSDSLDHKAQRAKLKEMAAQRAKQLQEEEEERTREQKAKALAKLEELNRRAAAQSMKQKLNNTLSPRNSVQHQEDSGVDTASETNAVTINPPADILVGNIDSFFQTSGSENKKHGTSVALPLNSASHNSKTVSQDSTAPIVPSLSMEHKTNTTEVTSQDGSQSHVTGGSKHKQMGYRRRQKVPLEKNAGEKPIMMENAGLKYLDEVVHDRNPDEKPVTAENKESPENLVKVNTPLSNSDMLLHNGDPSLQHKKKNSRNSRNKNKDEALMGSSISVPAHSNENSEECRSESFKSHPAVSVTETSSVTAQVFLENSESQDSRDGVVHSYQRCSKIIEEAHGRMSNQWKPQPPRRPARNQQIIRSMDKVHGSETVIWAPIKPANKNEQSEEISQSSSVDYQSSQRNEHDMHNGMRTKRAEMERYVPKPVAKELLQQENTRKSSTYFNQSASGNMPEKSYSDSKGTGMGKCDGSSVGNTEVIADTKKGEDKPSKRSRAHASWRQRSSSETTLQSSNESLNSSDATKHFNKPSDQHLSSPEQLKSDGWESSSNPVPKDLVVLPDVIKDQGITSRLRCQQVHRVAGSNYAVPDHHHLQSGIDDKSGMGSHILDLNETDARNSIRGDNKNIVGEHIRPHSQWKPKSQTCSQNQQQGNRGNEGQRKFSHDGRSKKFSSLCFESNPSCNENKSALLLKDDSHVVTDAGHQDTTGAEMGTCNSDLSKEQMHITEPDAPTNTALPPGDVNAQHQNQVSPPPRRHGHRNGRFNRGQEATYRSRDLSQISGVSNVQINGDQRKKNSHFGYQPIGSYNKPSDLYQSNSNIDQEAQGHHASRQRYKERVQTQTGNPGHFIRRNSGAAAHDD